MDNSNFMKPIIFLVVLNLSFGCASFPKKQGLKSTNINTSTINLLQGTYAINHWHSDTVNDSVSDLNITNNDLDHYPTLFDEINNGLLVKRLKMKSLKSYKFSLKVLSTKRIEINYFEDDSVIKRNKIRYKLKEDGFVYIKHGNFKVIGIPYVMGGFKSKKSRLALTRDNNLLLETAEFRTGGVFHPAFNVPCN